MTISSRNGGQRTFGRRDIERVATAVPAFAAKAIVARLGPAPATPAVVTWASSSLPDLTAGLVVVLTAIFLCELRVSGASGTSLTIDGSAFSTLGGIGRTLFIQQHEWWRFFTAPWLHGGLDHLVGNLIVLAVVGTMLVGATNIGRPPSLLNANCCRPL